MRSSSMPVAGATAIRSSTEIRHHCTGVRHRVADGDRALFVGPKGRRLAPRAVDLVVRGVGERAGLGLSAHVLRHTCVTNLVRAGNDLVFVAELAGHRRLETTRRCSLPSEADRQAAMDAIEIEH